MNRRGFLRAMVGGVALGAAQRAWPFRVYSFSSQPVAIQPEQAKRMLAAVKKALAIDEESWLIWNEYDWILNQKAADRRFQHRMMLAAQGLIDSPVIIT